MHSKRSLRFVHGQTVIDRIKECRDHHYRQRQRREAEDDINFSNALFLPSLPYDSDSAKKVVAPVMRVNPRCPAATTQYFQPPSIDLSNLASPHFFLLSISPSVSQSNIILTIHCVSCGRERHFSELSWPSLCVCDTFCRDLPRKPLLANHRVRAAYRIVAASVPQLPFLTIPQTLCCVWNKLM